MTGLVEAPIYRLRDRRTLDFYEDACREWLRGSYGRRKVEEQLAAPARAVLGSIEAGEPFERTEAALADLREAVGWLDAMQRKVDRVQLEESLREASVQKLTPGFVKVASAWRCAGAGWRCGRSGSWAVMEGGENGLEPARCKPHAEKRADSVGREAFAALVTAQGSEFGSPTLRGSASEHWTALVAVDAAAREALGAEKVDEMEADFVAEWGPIYAASIA